MLCLAPRAGVDMRGLERDEYAPDFEEAARVGDGVSLAFRAMALGRWLVGPGGKELHGGESEAMTATAREALHWFSESIGLLRRQGMDPWIVYCVTQMAKAHADRQEWEEAHECIDDASQQLARFRIWSMEVLETIGQLHLMRGDTASAQATFEAALEAAEEQGLSETNKERLGRYLSAVEDARGS